MGIPKDIPGIPGHLVLILSIEGFYYSTMQWEFLGKSRESGILSVEGSAIYIALCDGSSQGYPRNPGTLSIEGSTIIALCGDSSQG